MDVDGALLARLGPDALPLAWGLKTSVEDAEYCLARFLETQAALNRDSPSRRPPFIYAKAFAMALHMGGSCIEQFADLKQSAKVRQIADAYWRDFDGLKGIRDSMAHQPERFRGRSLQKGKIKPMNQPGPLYIENLLGDHLQYSDADKVERRVRVCPASFAYLRRAAEQTFAILGAAPPPNPAAP